MLVQVYFNQHLVAQGVINIVCAVVCFGYLIVYFPFKNNFILASNLAGEICTVAVFGISLVYLWDVSQGMKEMLELVIIGLVLLAIVVQFLISLWMFFESIVKFWRKVVKARHMAFVENARKVYPEVDIPSNTNLSNV